MKKRILFDGYANYIQRLGIWLDKPFFDIVARIFPDIQIALVTRDDEKKHGTGYNISMTWPVDQKLEMSKCTLIFYDGNDHYKQVERTPQAFEVLLAKFTAQQGVPEKI